MADNIELKNNLMSFRETFREYTDYYTVIGGTACMILMEEASRDFRATKDVDMIPNHIITDSQNRSRDFRHR